MGAATTKPDSPNPASPTLVPVPLIPQSVLTEIADAHSRRDPDRWRSCHVQVTPQAADIVTRVWGTQRSLRWQVLATALIAQYLEDGQPTPKTSVDPVRVPLELLIGGQVHSPRQQGQPLN